MLESELKRKLRALKKLEIKIRYLKDEDFQGSDFIWDTFFSIKEAAREQAKYSLSSLQSMERETRKRVIEHYIYEVFIKSFQEGRIECGEVFYNIQVLDLLGIPWNATAGEIKTRFRHLAKLYHPDQGGEAEKMLQLLEVYEKIFPKKTS